MKVLSVAVVFFIVVACRAAPQQKTETDSENSLELFSGIVIERDPNGSDTLNVRFKPGELQEAARTFEEAGRAKLKKYTPLITSLGVKALAVLGIVFGVVTLLVTKAIFVAKVAFLAAAALGLQRWITTGQLPVFGKLGSESNQWASVQPQWSASAATNTASYPYARSNEGDHDSNELAYRGQMPTQQKD